MKNFCFNFPFFVFQIAYSYVSLALVRKVYTVKTASGIQALQMILAYATSENGRDLEASFKLLHNEIDRSFGNR